MTTTGIRAQTSNQLYNNATAWVQTNLPGKSIGQLSAEDTKTLAKGLGLDDLAPLYLAIESHQGTVKSYALNRQNARAAAGRQAMFGGAPTGHPAVMGSFAFQDTGAAMGALGRGRGVLTASQKKDLQAFRAAGFTAADARHFQTLWPDVASEQQAMLKMGKMLGSPEGVGQLMNMDITPGAHDPQDSMAAFERSGYSLADAEATLAHFPMLGDDIDNAKRFVGKLIIEGNDDLQLAGFGITPKADAHDAAMIFGISNYSERDAVTVLKELGANNGLETVNQAKQFIGMQIVSENEQILEAIGVTPQLDRNEALQACNASDLKAHVAEVQAKYGLLTPDDARAYIGFTILEGNEVNLRRELGIPNKKDQEAMRLEAFGHSGYSPQDAASLMEQRGLPSLRAAKIEIGRLCLEGDAGRAELEGLGISSYDFDDHECRYAFERSGYSEADVEAARQGFDFLRDSSDSGIKNYIGLKIINGYEELLRTAGITPYPFDDHECLAAFRSSRYTDADVQAARQAFSFLHDSTDRGIKEYLGLKIVNDNVKMLEDMGIRPGNYDDHELVGTFEQSGFTMKDVKLLQQYDRYHKNQDEQEIINWIGYKCSNGMDVVIEEALADAQARAEVTGTVDNVDIVLRDKTIGACLELIDRGVLDFDDIHTLRRHKIPDVHPDKGMDDMMVWVATTASRDGADRVMGTLEEIYLRAFNDFYSSDEAAGLKAIIQEKNLTGPDAQRQARVFLGKVCELAWAGHHPGGDV